MLNQIHSNEFIGKEPNWLIQFGTGYIFLFIAVVMILSWFIKYPDTIIGNIELTAEQSPVRLKANERGRITDIYVNDRQEILAGAPLLSIESETSYISLFKLEQIATPPSLVLEELISVRNKLTSTLSNSSLGEVQEYYNNYLSSMDMLIHLLKSNETSIKIDQINKTLESLDLKISTASKRSVFIQQKLDISEILFAKKTKMFNDGLVPEAIYLEDKNKLIDQRLNLLSHNEQKQQLQIEKNNLISEKALVTTLYNQEREKLFYNSTRRFQSLKNSLKEWKRRYLIVSPTNGIVSFSEQLSRFQHVNKNDELITVASSMNITRGNLIIEEQGAGKIKIGQKVLIELDHFPAYEFGTLKGFVKSVAMVPGTQGRILVTIDLPPNLVTDQGFEIPTLPEINGKARIVTEKKRLIHRLLSKLMYKVTTT